MSSASIQKLFCGIYSTFKCSFDEFVGEKVFSPSYSSAILAPPPKIFKLKNVFRQLPFYKGLWLERLSSYNFSRGVRGGKTRASHSILHFFPEFCLPCLCPEVLYSMHTKKFLGSHPHPCLSQSTCKHNCWQMLWTREKCTDVKITVQNTLEWTPAAVVLSLHPRFSRGVPTENRLS